MGLRISRRYHILRNAHRVRRSWIFVGAADGSVFSLNAQTGCIYWIFKATEGVRTGPVISGDGKIAYLADLHANIFAVNAETGALIWQDHMERRSPDASISGTPKLDGDHLYVPVSGGEEINLWCGEPRVPLLQNAGKHRGA